MVEVRRVRGWEKLGGQDRGERDGCEESCGDLGSGVGEWKAQGWRVEWGW